MNTRRFIFALLVQFSLAFSSAEAKDIFVGQSGTGSGSSCVNARDANWFNTQSNWATSPDKISAGDTVHLCGTLITTLNVLGSGTDGNPITILFEPGAKLSQPAGTLMNAGGRSHLIIDGGSNGIIENTDNGSNKTFHVASAGIYAPGISESEIKNLTIQNLYVHSSVDDSTIDFGAAGGIYFNGFGNNVSIHHNHFHDICWILVGGGAPGAAGLDIHDNDFQNYDHGIAGIGGSMAAPARVNIYNNHFGSTANWDTTANSYHHDGIHIFFAPGGTFDGVNIYNNLFDGNWGNNNTGHIFLEGDWSHQNPNALSNFNFYNNVFIQYPSNILNDGFVAGGGASFHFYNNTFIGSGVRNSFGVLSGGKDFVFQNNVVTAVTDALSVSSNDPLSPGAFDHNVYANLTPGGISAFGLNGTGYPNLSAFSAGVNQEQNSVQVTDAVLSTAGIPNAQSPVIGVGANLTTLNLAALKSDARGTSRPLTGNWDAGAFQYAAASSTPTAPKAPSPQLGTAPSSALTSLQRFKNEIDLSKNESTEIPYVLRNPAHVELSILTRHGQLVSTLINEDQIAGVHSVTWPVAQDNRPASGVYLVRFKADAFTQLRKIVVIK